MAGKCVFLGATADYLDYQCISCIKISVLSFDSTLLRNRYVFNISNNSSIECAIAVAPAFIMSSTLP